VADVRYGHPQFGQLARCGCLEATLVAARQAAAAARADTLTQQLAAELGRLASCTLDTIDRRRPCVDLLWQGQAYPQAEQRRLLNRACGLARHYVASESLYLYGPPGGAKSHLAAAILNAQAQAGVAGRYGSMPALLRLLRGGFRDGTADERLEALMIAELLVIDDLGVEQGGDWAYAQFFDLLSIRINRGLPTIITSNLPPDRHEPRIASRIAGEFALLPLILSDYRLVQAEQRAARRSEA
jgi:DNA replication protein DnaC